MAMCYYCNEDAQAQCQECGVFVCDECSSRCLNRKSKKIRVYCNGCTEQGIISKEFEKLDKTHP